MREAVADLQGGGQDHRRGGMRPEQGKGRGERKRPWQRMDDSSSTLEPDGTKRRQMMIDEQVQAGHGRRLVLLYFYVLYSPIKLTHISTPTSVTHH